MPTSMPRRRRLSAPRLEALEDRCTPSAGDLLRTLGNPAANSGDQYGYSIAMSEKYVVVGAPFDDPGGITDAGSVYLFDRETGELVRTIPNPEPEPGDRFGHAVVLTAIGGYIGAPFDDPGGVTDSGKVYGFGVPGGYYLDYNIISNPSPAAGDQFGYSLGGDHYAEWMAIGAPGDDFGATDAGRAYITRFANPFILRTANNPAPAVGDRFGESVAVTFLGDMLIGAPGDDIGSDVDTGRAFLYNEAISAINQTYTSPSPAAGDRFGASVAFSGNTMVWLIGAPGRDPSGVADAGAVFAYETYTTGGTVSTPIATLNNPQPTAGDNFGAAVAASELVTLVGAPGDDPGGVADAGSVYSLRTSTGELLATLANPNPTANDQLGAVAVFGSRGAVGAALDDAGGLDSAGIAYVFDTNNAPRVTNDTSVVLRDAGPTEVVGLGTDSGLPDLGETLTVSQVTQGANGTVAITLSGTGVTYAPLPGFVGTDAFTYTVSDGRGGTATATVTVIVTNPPGSGLLATLGTPGQRPQYTSFGTTVAATDSWLLVRRNDTAPIGVYNPTTGALLRTLSTPLPAEGLFPNTNVAISGNRALFGAYNAAYLYDLTSGALLQTFSAPSSNSFFGISVALDGDNVVIGSYEDWEPYGGSNPTRPGRVYVYSASTGNLVRTITNPTFDYQEEGFGSTVAVSGDTLVVGAYQGHVAANVALGQAYVFDLSTGTLRHTLNSPARHFNQLFGISVAISGNRVAVGAREQVYLFDATTGALLRSLGDPTPTITDNFGATVAISGGRVLVGARGDDPNGVTDVGKAYLFDASTGTYLRKFDAPFAAAGDQFGVHVALTASRAVVGAWQSNPATGAGAAYLFDLNYPPTAKPDAFVVAEDSSANFLNVLANDPVVPGEGNLSVISFTSPSHGTVTLIGGGLRYTPTANYSGSDTFTYTGRDSLGRTATATVSITVSPVNDAPAGASKTVTTPEDTVYTIDQVDFGFTDPTDSPPNDLFRVKITSLPAAGSLRLDGAAVSAGAFVTVADIAAGKLQFTPGTNANGAAYAAFTFQVQDDGGTAGGGIDLDPTPRSLTIDVTAVNDAPSFTKGSNQTILEDAGPKTVFGWATNISAGPANETGQSVTFLVTTDNPSLFSAGPAVASNGTLTYTAAANANGIAIVTVTATDNGGTANGGVNTSAPQTFTVTVTAVNDAPGFTKGADQNILEDAGAQTVTGWATNIAAGPANEASQTLAFTVTTNNDALFSVLPSIDPATGTLTFTPAANAVGTATVTVTATDNGGTANGGANASASQTFTVTVTPVNDAPTFTKGADQTDLEDAGARTVTGWATSISAGPANEASQTITFTVSTDNPGLFSAGPALAANGTLTYTTAANANGSATVTVTATDNGGTDNGGVNTSAQQTFTITVTAVNDAPGFTKGADQTVLEDAGTQTVSGWATNVATGPANEASQTVAFTVTTNNDALFSVLPSIDPATGTLTFTPAANAFGTATVTVTVTDDGGTANGGANVSASQTFTVTVTPVNDVPGFTKGTDQAILEDAGELTVTGWATNISAGPANEASQTLAFIVTTNNDALFAALPSIDPATGTLTFTPAANVVGTATVTVTATDNGGTTNGGANSSAPQTFTITITAVNDAPSFTKGADQIVPEDGGTQTVTGWATNVSAGPANEASQTLAFTVTTNNDALFSVLPTIDPATGTLTFTAVANANGTATVTVAATDNGGTDNGGVNSSQQTFTITILPVNDAPSFTKGADQTALEDTGARTVTGWATNLSTGPANEASQAISFTVSNNNPALFQVAPSVSATGILTYTPAANAVGTATVTVTAKDDGGTANGGVNTSAPQTFTITLTPVNDAPIVTASNPPAVDEDAGAVTVAGFAAFTAGPPNESGQQLVEYLVDQVSNPSLFAVLPAVSPAGTLTYTPAANANGFSAFRLRVRDDGGVLDGGVDLSAGRSLVITVNPANDGPVASGDALDAFEDRPLTVASATLLANDTDIDSFSLSVVVVAGPSHGTLTPTVGGFVYQPLLNYSGPDSFTYKVNDGGLDSNIVTVALTVHAVNDVPTLSASDPAAVAEDAGQQTLTGWAVRNAGAPDESGQTLSYEVEVLTNPGLFSAAPSLSAAGTLTYTPAANANGTATFRARVHDNGGTADGGADTSAWQSFTVTVNAVNDAPALPATVAYLPAITRLNGNPPGRAVSGLLQGTTDLDGEVPGVAVVGAAGAGTWQYRLGNGAWRAFGPVSAASARLLRGSDQVRFVPRRTFNAVAILVYRAWDQTAGAAGATVNLTSSVVVGGTTAFSGTTRTGYHLVNSAPVMKAAPRSFGAINEDTVLAAKRVSTLLTNRVTDADPAALKGIAIRGSTGAGAWQYSLNGRTWLALNTVSNTAARLLPDTALLRFVPSPNATGAATLNFRAWDRKLGAVGGVLDLQATGVGGSWSVSGAAANVSLVVRPVNDAPVLPTSNVTLPGISRTQTNPSGMAVSLLLAGRTDADPGARSGVAILGRAGGGTWQYSVNGGATWLTLTATAAQARLLRDTDLVRFVPNGTFTGNATLTFRAWDRTSGAVGGVANLTRATSFGGKTAFSVATRVALLPITE